MSHRLRTNQSRLEGNMKQQPFTLSAASSTLLIIMLISTRCFASASKSDTVSLYPCSFQPEAQQDHNRNECQSCAVCLTGLEAREPVAQAAVVTPVPATPYQRPHRHVARGAARGAAVGAVGGAITGDPAKGAAAGAAMGGTAGAFRRRDQRRQQSVPQQPAQPYPQ